MLILLLLIIICSSGPRGTEGYWSTTEAYHDCNDCNGTGRVECNYTGSNDFIDCPCTMRFIRT